MKTEVVNGTMEIITPCTLVLYRCGCAEVLADALVDLPSIDTEYMPLSRISDVEDGGPFADHIHDQYGGCRLTGMHGCVGAYVDFCKYYGLTSWSR